jgi:hypothetical protein
MNDEKSGKDTLANVPAWVRSDPEVLREWLAIDWEAEARLFDRLGGRENQAVLGGVRKPKPK